MRFLVIAAHPDDEVLGCGGTIASLVQQGATGSIAIMGEGGTSRYADPSTTDADAPMRLREMARQAAGILGVHDLAFAGLPDNRLDSIDHLDLVRIVEERIEQAAPDVVYTHHPGDLNIDHALVHRAVVTATRPVSGCRVRDLYAFEVPSSSEWAFGVAGAPFDPNVFVDITSTFELKLKAMECYSTELRPFPFPRSREALSAIATRWGSVAGLVAAEAFRLIRSVR